jgi:predicted nucleotidyltransferase
MDTKTDNIVKLFVKKIREKIPHSKIFLFGSHAKGTAKKNSDYDFLIISKDFKNSNLEERHGKVYFLKKDIPAAMDILCYTPEEFEKKKKQIGIVRTAVEEGIEIR